MTRDTQRAAYYSILDSLQDKERKVLEVIERRPSALFEIATELGWPINRVSGRVTRLTDKKVVEDSGERRVNPESGMRCTVWRVKPRPTFQPSLLPAPPEAEQSQAEMHP